MANEATTTLEIYGLPEFGGEVEGEVLAEKFAAFMRGLVEADLASNGVRRHRFVVTNLIKSSAIATVQERARVSKPSTHSAALYYSNALRDVRENKPTARRLPVRLVRTFGVLGRGLGKRFYAANVLQDGEPVVNIDKLFAENAARVLGDIKAETKPLAFTGTAYGTFDGVLKAADFRPALKRGVLWLTAGNTSIEINISNIELEEVAEALERRCRVSGLAHYDGLSGLPRLVDVNSIEPIEPGGGLARWRGAFDLPLYHESWGDN
ncbi:MAG: hypothetical protein CMP81_16415 [Fulvimarina sp.]|nr:hypothetical protein [Fulvimarina sp.]